MMRLSSSLLTSLLLLCGSSTIGAFSVGRPSLSCQTTSTLAAQRGSASSITTAAATTTARTNLVLWSSSDDDSDDAAAAPSARKKRVRRRKDSSVTTEEEAPQAAAPAIVELKPRQESAPMQVMDIRDLVGGTSSSSSSSSKSAASSPEATSSTKSATPKNIPLASSSGAGSNASNTGNLDESLELLLQDAKKMQAVQDIETQKAEDSGESTFSLPDSLRNVISTVVTVDFFVVCGFLVWFLAGIVVRSVADDDSVQIAFNNQFETLVQPALGLLMVASAAGAVFSEDEEDGMM